MVEREAVKENAGTWRSDRVAPERVSEERRDALDGPSLDRAMGRTPGRAPRPEVARLFGSAALAQSANRVLRTSAMHRVQQIYGNRTCACGGTCDRCATSTKRAVQARDGGTDGRERASRLHCEGASHA